MKKVLLIDNTFDPPHGSPEIRARLEAAAKEIGPIEITMVRGPENQIPEDLSDFDGAVLSGSKTRIYENAPWIQRELAAIQQLHELKVPTLGICYGEQMIVRALGGEKFTGIAKRPEHGWVQVETLNSAGIMSGLPMKFWSFGFHKDEVFTVPPGFQLLASSEDCPVQAFAVKDAPMWGVQFHPERGLEEGNRSLDRKLKEDPAFLALNRDKGEKVFDPAVAKTIFHNFLQRVWVKD